MFPLLKITNTGYLIIILILFSVFISLKISKRLEDKGCLSISFTFILFLSVISIFVSTFYMSVDSLKTYFYGDSYSAKIVNYKTNKERQESTDGRYRFKTLHITIFKFDDKYGDEKVLESVTHSGSIPEVGKTVKVSYFEGSETVLEHNFKTYFLLFIGFLFSIIFGFISITLIKYTFGYSVQSFKSVFVKALIIGFKMGLTLFTFGLVYPIYNYLFGESDMPVWAFVTCLIFFLILLFSLYAVFKGFRNKAI
ncbi:MULTISPECIES: hypothetical protein [Flavobacterium]|uniref:DUF3592 domain-containing protein n=1 Tax=Flavobacterium hankyongi TaxID=1176532 RepID=A0ABP8ZK65_9FLAO|nr:hypothetical protein [Flavobacterium sp. N1846]